MFIGTALIFGTEQMMIEYHIAIRDFNDLYAEEPITVWNSNKCYVV